jgi:hypothetical protein
LLLTGSIIAGSANTKGAELKYLKLDYEQDIKVLDKAYDNTVKTANKTYDTWLEDHKAPASDAEDSVKNTWEESRKTAEKNKTTAIENAAKLRDDSKETRKDTYELAVLDVKRDSDYRASSFMTTDKSIAVEHVDSNITVMSTKSVLTPAGALIVWGSILTIAGLGLGTGLFFVVRGKKAKAA